MSVGAVQNLIIELDGRRCTVGSDWFLGAADYPLRQACLGASGVLIELSALLSWQSYSCKNAICFFAELSRQHSNIGFIGSSSQSTSLFEATLSLIPADSPVRNQLALLMALVAVATTLPHAIPVACTRIANHLRALGLGGVRVDALIEQATKIHCQIYSTTQITCDQNLMTVHDMLTARRCPPTQSCRLVGF
jgi:hypothetical protein